MYLLVKMLFLEIPLYKLRASYKVDGVLHAKKQYSIS